MKPLTSKDKTSLMNALGKADNLKKTNNVIVKEGDLYIIEQKGEKPIICRSWDYLIYNLEAVNRLRRFLPVDKPCIVSTYVLKSSVSVDKEVE